MLFMIKKTSEIWIVLQKLDINETVFVLSDARIIPVYDIML